MKYKYGKKGIVIIVILVGLVLLSSGIANKNWYQMVGGMFLMLTSSPFSIIRYDGAE